MNPSTPPPPVSPALVEWLERAFPDRLPETPITQELLGVRIGEQRIIRKLRHIAATQVGG